jgi:hypothetical protein
MSISGAFENYRLLALIPALGIAADYLITFSVAGSSAAILQYEFSPLVRIATAYGLMVPYLVFMMLLYYALAYAVLRILAGSDLYPIGVAMILLMSLTHVMGGLSWIVRNDFYTGTVHGLSLMTIVLGIAAFGFAVLQRHTAHAD